MLNVSTAQIDPQGDIERDGTRGVAAELGPIADRLGPFWNVDRRRPAADPSLATEASIDRAEGPTGPPGTVGPLREGHGEGLNGLCMRRPGTSFGDYELLAILGTGGMGVVYEARQKRLNRTVALKMIKTGILAGEPEIRWFRREAEAVARLDHPNIVPVLESGEHLGVLYYSMKRIDGQNLQKSLGRFRDRPEAIARLVARVAGAIDHAHRRGVLHRDLKPSNILVDERGRAARHRLRPGQAAGDGRRDVDRAPGGHAQVHVARAGPRRSGRDHRGGRRLRPGRRPVYPVDGPAAVLGSRRRGGDPRRRAMRSCLALASGTPGSTPTWRRSASSA